jgi:hypothetical protein
MNEVQNITTSSSSNNESNPHKTPTPSTNNHHRILLPISKVMVNVEASNAPPNPAINAIANFLNLTKKAAHKFAAAKRASIKTHCTH